MEFVWGAMFAIKKRTLGDLKLTTVWADGCYSEDMLLGNLCRARGLRIEAPPLCMTVNALPVGHTFRRSYCNYIER